MSEEGINYRNLLMALLVVATFSMGVLLVTSSMTDYQIVKPLIVGINPQPSEVKLVTVDFKYDTLTSTYTNASVAVRNEGPANVSVSVTITIEFFDSQSNSIALAQVTTDPIKPRNTLFIVIPITWEAGKTVNDFSSGKVTIS